ncbi:complement factor D-like [Aphidius gifuensis]|nr:complement factor D-like [Aphidius gifuensis]
MRKSQIKKDREFTFLVSVRRDGKHICQGALFTLNSIIVPAHCVECKPMDKSGLQVLVGTDDLNDTTDKLFDVSKVTCKGNSYNPDDDIALLTLSKSVVQNVNFQERIGLVNDPMLGQLESDVVSADVYPAHYPVYAVGWGLNNDGTGAPTKFETQFLDKTQCFNADGKLAGPKRLCTNKTKEFDICKGNNDVILISDNTIIGIATKNACKTSKNLNVFTRLSRYRFDFLEKDNYAPGWQYSYDD